MKIVMIMAITADGKIGKDAKHEANWTSKEDKKAFVEETKKHGVIIMGRTTFETINRPLPGRLNLILTSSPEKYQNRTQENILEFFKGSPEETVKMLESRNFKSAALGGGAKTNAKFLKAGLVDELLLTIEPKIFGHGVSIAEGADLDVNLELLETKKLNDNSIQLRYKVLK